MTKNAYIHIPFCRQKCNYCSFVSYPLPEYKKEYLKALSSEIKTFYKSEKLNTLYFGGGTPSLLAYREIRDIISLFNINSDTEITMELNPENLDEEYLNNLFIAGINRISIGCQTFDEDILHIIGRKHSAKDVKKAVFAAQKTGFKNISLDFIYGLPNQTVTGFEKDLKQAVELGIQHISLYGLKIDKGCYFYNNKPDNLPDNDIQADMYLKAIEILGGNNYKHYEISNFSLAGFESKHNMNYWDNNSYYGFGVAAHGYIDGIRYSNSIGLKDYIQNPTKRSMAKQLTEQEKLEEEIFLGFRRNSGIDTELINNKYNIDFEEKYGDIIKKYLDTKHIVKTDKGFCLSVDGILVSNYILADFIE